MDQKIRLLYLQAGIDEPKVIDKAWIKSQRSHWNKKRTTNRPIPEYVFKCIDSHWELDKKWSEVSDDVKKKMVEEIKTLYEENKDEPNGTVTPQWIRLKRRKKKENMMKKQKRQTDSIYNEEQKAKRTKRDNKRIQVEFDGDCKAYLSHQYKRAREIGKEKPEIYVKRKRGRRRSTHLTPI